MPPKKRTRSPTGITTTTTDASTTSTTTTTTDSSNKKEYCFVGLRDKELQELIIKSGGSIVTNVTNTVIVVCKAGEENTKKVQDSAALGAQLVTREDLKNQLHDPTADPATKKQAVEDPNPPKSTRGRKPAAASVPVPVAVAAPVSTTPDPTATTPDPAATTTTTTTADPTATTPDPNAATTTTTTTTATTTDPSSTTAASTTTPDPTATTTAATTTTTTTTTTTSATPVAAPALDPEAEKLYPGGIVVVDGSNVFEAFLTKPDGRKKIPIYVTLQLIHIPKKGRKKEFYTTFTKTSDSTEDVIEDIVSSTLEDGKAQFEALFLLKTGNKWTDRNSFTPKKGSFVISSTPPPNPTAAQAAAAAAAASAPAPAPTARRGRSATNSLPPARASTPSPPPSPKAKRGRKAANAPVLATLPTGAPALVSTPSTTQAGCIDAVAKTLLPDADVVVHAGDIYDVALAQVDVSTNTDKYYIIQVLVSSARRQPDKYYVFLRWGRTGSNGQNQLHGAYSTLAEAIEVFEDKFHEKTDNDWSARKSFVKKKGFYELLRVDHANKASRRLGTTPVAKWEYYVDDHVDGKATGWYEYTADGAAETEELWVTYQSNPHMSQRVVESGKFSYLVDLGKMTQVNVSHPARKVRNIRRNYHGVITQGTTTATSTTTAPSSLIAAAPAPLVVPAPILPTAKPAKVVKTPTPAAPPASTPSGPVVRPVDNNCPLSSRGSVSVVDNYDIMLNQADIKANKNKFYRIQLLFNSADSNYYFWTRWGRVGEIGQSNLDNCGRDKNAGIAAFKKKFKDKTSERWEDGPPYTPRSGKYEVIDMKFGASAPPPLALVSASGIVPPSKLDDKTRQLMEIIFDTDMFKSAMTDIKVDLTRMPLGAITVSQLEKGYAVLKEIEALLTKPSLNSRERDHLISLSGNFYQVIPHSYARSTRPPPIDSNELLSEKLNMINTLKDIEVAQSVLGNASSAGSITENPIDAKYRQLDADLELLDPNSPDYALITTFMDQTLGHYKRNVKLYDIWKVRRHPEDTTFPAFESIDNHHLLWHGTNIAVVAAILKTGLRIMPAVNGGRVGRGIYLADKLEKSVSYVRPTRRPDGTQLGIAFLAQAAMGRVKEITRDDGSLVAAPSGYDSVIARGREEPDPAARTTFKIDGKDVTIHQGGMVQTGVSSSFSQNEYLVYRESQQRLRYVISFKIQI